MASKRSIKVSHQFLHITRYSETSLHGCSTALVQITRHKQEKYIKNIKLSTRIRKRCKLKLKHVNVRQSKSTDYSKIVHMIGYNCSIQYSTEWF